MKKFLRENPTIAFGLGLPLLLVAVFLLISGIPALLVAPPQYDVLYSTGYYNSNSGMQIAVVNQRVQVNYLGRTQGYQNPRLWRFNPKTGAIREVALLLPPDLAPAGPTAPPPGEAVKVTPISVPELATLGVDASSIAPDGYRFSTGSDRYSGHFFTGLFYSSRYRHQAELLKDGRSIRLPHTDGMYYSHDTHFIGWVVAP
jgi:hypothetical protein